MGAQALYDLHVSFHAGVEASATTRRVGFRYFALVTGNDTDPAFVAAAKDQEGTESHGMYFRVNGAALLVQRLGERQGLGNRHIRMICNK